MNSTAPRRVAVTGLGVVSAIGTGVPEFREGLVSGRCGIGPVTVFDTEGFPSQVAAEAKGDLDLSGVDPKVRLRVSRCDLLGLAAVQEAVEDAGLAFAGRPDDRMGVVLGGGAGGMLSWERYRRALHEGRVRRRPSPLLASAPCTLTDLIAARYGLNGYRATVCTACSSSATSIGYGFDLIRSGKQDVVFVGGSEALSELTFAGFNALRLVDPGPCRPFDRERRGLSLGEAGAILVLEEYEAAKARGSRIYAQVLGYAINSDAYHMTSPDPEARGMTRVMEIAMTGAGLTPDAVDYINAHGTATKVNDQTETRAIKNVFGEEGALKVPVSSTKSMVGHCLGAAGAVEAVATVLAVHGRFLPPTVHLQTPDPECDLDYVANRSRAQEIRVALSNSFAFGGNNTCLVFGSAEMGEGANA